MTNKKKRFFKSKQQKFEEWNHRHWYSLRPLLGCHFARFFVLVGPRECGKSYSVMEFLVKQWKNKGIPFNWIRLSQESLDLMLANDGMDFIDKPLVRKYGLDLHTKGNNLYDGDKLMCRGFALSTMAKQKGVALFDHQFLDDPNMWYHIGIDEFNREKGEKKYFPLVYNLVNTLENLLRSTNQRIRVFFMANLLDDASDVLSGCFGFLPLDYGVYKIHKKQCVIDYIRPNETYNERRKEATANILSGNTSTFTNKITRDFSLIDKRRRRKPLYIIAFSKNNEDKFTVWNNNIIAPYNGEKVRTIAMRPYLDCLYNKKTMEAVKNTYNARGYHFISLIVQTNFRSALELLKPMG